MAESRAGKPVSQVGAVLKQLREAQGLNQTELGKLVGVTQSTISALEREAIPFSFHYARLLAPHLNVSRLTLERMAGLIDEGHLNEEQRRVTEVFAQYPVLMGLLARMDRLGTQGQQRFLRAMQKFVELEEEDYGDGTDAGAQKG